MRSLPLLVGSVFIVAVLGLLFQRTYAQSCLDTAEAAAWVASIEVLYKDWEAAQHDVRVARTIYLGFVAATGSCLALAKSQKACATLIGATKAALGALEAARTAERRAFNALRAEQRAFERWIDANC